MRQRRSPSRSTSTALTRQLEEAAKQNDWFPETCTIESVRQRDAIKYRYFEIEWDAYRILHLSFDAEKLEEEIKFISLALSRIDKYRNDYRMTIDGNRAEIAKSGSVNLGDQKNNTYNTPEEVMALASHLFPTARTIIERTFGDPLAEMTLKLLAFGVTYEGI